jgi:hypothetical protein
MDKDRSSVFIKQTRKESGGRATCSVQSREFVNDKENHKGFCFWREKVT